MTNTYTIELEGKKFTICKPLLKWVGGKQKLLSELISKFPKEIDNYHEPFIGGGSVLFGLLSLIDTGLIKVNKTIYAYDLNADLISFYKNIQKSPEELYEEIKSLKSKIKKIDILKEIDRKNKKKNIKKIKKENSEDSKEMYYYWIRKNFNSMTEEERYSVKGSAYLLFLNKTCFRGLYRVNKTEFNVPYGNYNNPEIASLKQINNISQKISKVEFMCLSFTESLNRVKKKDFIYLDPPYAPEDSSSFVNYTKEGFSLENHKLLFDMVNKLKAKFLLSNSKVELVTESFSNKKFTIETIECRRTINSKKPGSKTKEVLIYN